MSLIESQFELKTKKGEDKTEIIEAYRVLVNFWHCIKIHVPNVLSCVSQVFPHYTKHDVSHSYAILDSIERILGEEAIKKLSVTDLWLLLCSAYYHDIGMYISGNEIKECFNSEEFKNYVFDLKDDTKSPLNKYASFYVSEKDKLNYDKCELTLDSYNSARFLLAAFFRDSHADRSENFLQSDSSVTEMFYEIKRLIAVIAEICRLHCAKFEEVMKFSEVENGVNGTEDYCHPRFVACMLRIGDLLDFDSSRVSKSLLDHLSSSTPSDSIIHNKKNYCITHALITPEKVDVYAECKEVEEAFEIDKWFTLIREEMSNQRNAWHDIASSTGIKGYPMCGTMETILLDHEKIDSNLKPKFEIDDEKVINILQGSGIYDNKFECIREILQNAVDATYLRIYLEKKKKFAEKSLDEGFDVFFNICKQAEYQIEVKCRKKEIEEQKEGKNKDEKKKYVWHLEIQDHGIGLRKSDLKYLMKIGSGRNNKDKFDIIKKMPEYAKPSGIFGIGFQSIFLITEKVKIRSRYAFSDEVIDVEVGTPLKGGFAVLKTEKNLFADKGTTISFDIIENMVINNKYVDYSSYYQYFSDSFDFLKNKTSDAEVAEILSAVALFSRKTYLNIACHDENKLNKKEDVEKTNGNNKEKTKDRRYKRIYQTENTDLIVEIPIENRKRISKSISGINDEKEYYYNGISILYRNQYVGGGDLQGDIRYIDIEINILSGCSDEVLSVDRESFKPEYVQKVKEPLKRIIIQWMVDNWNDFDDDGRKAASMFIEYYGKDGEHEDKREKWKKLVIYGIKFEKEIKYDRIIMESRFVYNQNLNDKENTNPKQKIIKRSDARCQFLGYVLRKYYKYGMYYEKPLTTEYCFWGPNVIFEKKHGDNMDWCLGNMDWPYWLEMYRTERCRSLMPCFGYDDLQIKEESVPENVFEPINLFEKNLYPRTICPYIVKDEKFVWNCSDELIQWVYENRFKEKTTIEMIKSAFEDVKKYLEKEVKKVNDKVENKRKKNDKLKKAIKSEIVPKSKKQVEGKAEPKAALKPKKQGNKKTDSDKKGGKASKAKSKKS